MSGFKTTSVLSLAILFAVPGRTADTRVIRRDLSRYMDRITERGFSGAILVAKDGNVILSKGYGALGARGGRVTTTNAAAERWGRCARSYRWFRQDSGMIPVTIPG
jgi:hypothetical protein